MKPALLVCCDNDWDEEEGSKLPSNTDSNIIDVHYGINNAHAARDAQNKLRIGGEQYIFITKDQERRQEPKKYFYYQ
jgi:hypothetical protein